MKMESHNPYDSHVLAALRDETPVQLRRRKAAVTHPEIYLQYGEQLRVGIHLPPRYSDPLRALAEMFFDPRGLWKGGDHYQQLIEAVAKVPEQVQASILARIPMGRFASPEEIAKAVLFLAADADYITGQQINVNGGVYM